MSRREDRLPEKTYTPIVGYGHNVNLAQDRPAMRAHTANDNGRG